jgi:HAMP domain-containing protein
LSGSPLSSARTCTGPSSRDWRSSRSAERRKAPCLAAKTTAANAKAAAAAAAVEGGSYAPGSLDPVAARRDEIGRLAQVFDRMARQVRAREERLQREIKELSVQIDEGKRRRQVAEITETDYFQDLQRRAEELRGRTAGEDS